jgi:hypothetical protein
MLLVLLVPDPVHRRRGALIDAELDLFLFFARECAIAITPLLKGQAGILRAACIARLCVVATCIALLFTGRIVARILIHTFKDFMFKRSTFDRVSGLRASAHDSKCRKQHEHVE